MAGFLSGVFDPGGSSAQSAEQSIGADVEQALDYEETVGVSHAESVSFETPDGTTHSFSNSQDVSVTVGIDAILGAAADVAGGSTSEEF